MDYAVIVTYKDRWNLLEQVLGALNKEEHLFLVIVSNGTPYDVKTRASKFNNTYVIHSETNKGSAWAFGAGMNYASLQTDAERVWLLDDDNLPDPGTLEKLRVLFSEKEKVHNKGAFMLMAVRKNRKYLVNVANGGKIRDNFPNQNDFLGVNTFTIWKRFFKINKKSSDLDSRSEIVIPCAPYGGLFFHFSVLQKIGLPDARYFVYADDFEFTYRLTRLKGEIILATHAYIIDLEETWQHPVTKSSVLPNLLTQPGNIVYYSIRNFVNFQKNNLVNKRFVFNLNRFIYSMYLYLLALGTGHLETFRRYSAAVKDGLNDNFNNNDYPI